MAAISERVKKMKVAIYVRVSTRYQVDKDSLQVQRRELIAYCEMILGIQDYVIFEDPGYSAKSTDRPDYQRMMNRLQTGEFSHLLVWKIDRISRNIIDFATMSEELKRLGVAFVSKNEQFDTSTAMGEAMMQIIMVFAQFERKQTSERVTAVMLSRAGNGQWNGGRVPYGYSYDKETKTFSLSPVENKVYNMICDIYEQYQSILYVARYLNSMGIRTRAGKEWTAPAIHKILSNVFYTGDYLYNVCDRENGKSKRDEDEWIRVENHHEPSITKERFERIRLTLVRNKRNDVKKGASRIRKNIHVFAGLIRCAKCGSNASATLDHRRADGWQPSVYACAKHRKNYTLCPNKYISDKVLGPFVINYIANIIRAKNNVSVTTSLETLERKLLRGKAFDEVEHIEQEGLADMLGILLSGGTGMEYRPTAVLSELASSVSEREILEDHRRRKETALNRLKALYLYAEEKTSEADFLIERERIMGELTGIEARLAELKRQESNWVVSNDEFVKKASYFIMVEKLLDGRYVDYEKYIRRIDPSIPRNFLNNIISQIIVDNGRVISISFKNGMTHRFIYKI